MSAHRSEDHGDVGAAEAERVVDRRDVAERQVTRLGRDVTVGPFTVFGPGVTVDDGVEIKGWLYRPHGASKPGPVVLSFHGGPEGQERPSFNSTYQALLAQGESPSGVAKELRRRLGIARNEAYRIAQEEGSE